MPGPDPRQGRRVGRDDEVDRETRVLMQTSTSLRCSTSQQVTHAATARRHAAKLELDDHARLGLPGHVDRRRMPGNGATPAEFCDAMRELAQGSGAIALALSMQTRQVVIAAGRWRHERAPVAVFLRRVNAEELILVTSGGSDWLAGFGRAERVDVND
jgi:hypothetical protein